MECSRISILITGSEILDSRVPDTNSHLIIERLAQSGFVVRHTLSCGDESSAIIASLKFLFEHSDAVIMSGGMGPTSDDLTREVVAELCGVSLERNTEVLEHIKGIYVARGRKYDASNDKQALFPHGAHVIPNAVGTAPGFLIDVDFKEQRKSLVALPGIPGELRSMLDESVLPLLARKVLSSEALTSDGRVRTVEKRQFRIFGLPESAIGAQIVESKLPKDIIVSYRAAFPEVHVVLKAPHLGYAAEVLDDAAQKVREAVGREYIFSEALDVSVDSTVHALLCARSWSISLAESFTGGMLGELLTSMPGSSATFLGGAVTYSNESKCAVLGVTEQSLKDFGAVSFQVAAELAQGAQRVFGSTLALSTTGIAGPDGGSQDKPVGTFFVGLATESGVSAYKCFFPSSRQRVRRYASAVALDIFRRHLLSLPIHWPSM